MVTCMVYDVSNAVLHGRQGRDGVEDGIRHILPILSRYMHLLEEDGHTLVKRNQEVFFHVIYSICLGTQLT
jgi:hypothetical protein